MDDLRARVAYLQGLAEGLNLSEESKEGKLLHAIIDVLTEFAEETSEMQTALDQLEEYIETVDEDLYALEDEFYEDDDFHCEECELADDDEYVEVNCSSCGETVMFDAEILEDDDIIEVICPNCDEVVFVNDDDYTSADEGEKLIAHKEEDDF